MAISRDRENHNTLVGLLGLEEETAGELIEAQVLLTYKQNDPMAQNLAQDISDLLHRTVRTVKHNSADGRVALEIIINNTPGLTDCRKIYVYFRNRTVIIRQEQVFFANTDIPADVHRVMLMLGACYAAAIAVKNLVPGNFRFPVSESIYLEQTDFVRDGFRLDTELNIEESHLVGAGAIGNSFLWGLSAFNVRGKMNIVDPDSVSLGNLNRCLLFTEIDVGKNKALCLKESAARLLPNVELVAYPNRLQDAVQSSTEEFPVKNLISAVDSRLARRNLQMYCPKRVFDASTTGVDEVVLHFNTQPSVIACMSCIYAENEAELHHEAHVADKLGVNIQDIKENFISASAAQKIHSKYPQLELNQIEGEAYDSLFKQLCGQGQLLSGVDKQVLAPFAFVSALAGVLLAIEFVQRIGVNDDDGLFNYWRVSPWSKPLPHLQRIRPRNPQCTFCNSPAIQKVLATIS